MLIAVAGAACSGDGPAIHSRIPSPDGRVDALVMRAGVPPGGDLAHCVQIVPAGGSPTGRDYDRFRADRVEGLRVAWTGDRTLVVEYAHARIYLFSNFWRSREVDDFGYVVEVRLQLSRVSSADADVP